MILRDSVFCAGVSLLYVIDLSEAPYSVLTWRLRDMLCLLPLLIIFLSMILSMTLWEVGGVKVVSCSVVYDLVFAIVVYPGSACF